MSIAIDNVACGDEARARFLSVLNEFTEAWQNAKQHSQRPAEIEQLVVAASASLPVMMNRLRLRDAAAADEWIVRLSQVDACLIDDVAYWQAEEAKLGSNDGSYSSVRSSVRGNINALNRCVRIVRDEAEYAASPSFKLLFDPILLISGEWGTGKTHLLCDVTSERLRREAPTVLVLAKNFEGNVLSDICARLGTEISVENMFAELEDVGQGVQGRTVFIVDGVNEGRRREWRQAIATLLSLVAEYPNIGLVVTCRTPFETIAIGKSDLGEFHRLQHYGFDDQEFDAQAAFFEYYKLPLPEVPLLDREFSRPLTLKLICQSLQNLSGKKLAKGFAGIASGQRGMTFVLESFVNRVGQPIEDQFGLRGKGCWILLKGDDQFSDKRISGFAPCMAANLRSYVFPSEADRIVAASYPTLRPAQRHKLLETMRTSGLIEEDVIWYSTQSGQHRSRVVYRLPYQRFSDHLIARHLLRAYLDVSSSAAIKRSFADSSPLGSIFQLTNRDFGHYAEPGWAQALITEFPERVGNKLPPGHRELFFALPPGAQDLNAYFEPFIEGLFWRNPTSFTEGTRTVINKYLDAGSESWERVVDALAAVATKPSHPYHAQRLYKYLSSYSMVDRDLYWSEYLRRRYASPTIHRLLTWAEKLDAVNMTRDAAAELVVLFSLVLTTVVRSDRDLATKALVLIGEQHPDVLFSHVVTCLDFNDPYLPERVLAATYGTALSLVDSENAASFQPLLGDLAQKVYRKMFAPRARHATHHTLMRDYALGIIEVAQRAGCVKLPKTAVGHLSRPFSNTPSPFTSDGTPDDSVTNAIEGSIQMDFGNYTIGGLIPNRANYDGNKPDYVRTRAKIERRIFDLGYRSDRFKHIESEIGQSSRNARDEHKVDRYGKKYSWIAYFEMWGERDANRRLPDWRQGNRTADCGVDPTFPKLPPDWTPPLPDLFGPPAASTKDWVAGGFTPNWHSLLVVPEINGHQGEWVLVEGFVQGTDREHDRKLFAFLRGMFVAKKDVDTLRSKFLSIDYPGNNKIPEGADEHYLFAGEPGHRHNFARHLLKHNGKYRRQTTEAFDEYVRDYSTGEKQSLVVEIASMLGEAIGNQEASAHEFVIPATRHIPGIRAELPSIHFGWESYHSEQNTFSGFDIPAPSLIQRLGLSCCKREIDFFDPSGRPATIYRQAGEGLSGDKHKLLYIRADLLRHYLKETRQVLVWCNWGERDWLTKMSGYNVLPNKDRQQIFQAYGHIHRVFSQWSAKDCVVLYESPPPP
ncbi:NACHT domain-containing NTPase [Chromobacterium sp. IIBBL 290-4]|uniref:NACHT domain-containing protein n=1 Tax=Chromobacterium sp. IIBBL 290-4 TaxID=2953890 RepID=UPI0020B74602|nr:ATP-binding protein [Chromobacterium sp. IIBBL 290-4]UTH74439.1 ATP-binding protein [Chromobacterium sp. IIBBL 290-4]